MIRTLIQWCYYTFGWFGCTKVSPGCKNCYMFGLAKRYHESRNVGPGAPRVLPKYFRAASASLAAGKRRGAPFTWDRQCAKLGIRRGVFPSLCDPFDDEVPIEWLRDLFACIEATPNLDWLLLTKRPHLWQKRVNAAKVACGLNPYYAKTAEMLHNWAGAFGTGAPPDNVWIGVSVENQEWADKRIPVLLTIPARVRFLSCEPLLGPINLVGYLSSYQGCANCGDGSWFEGRRRCCSEPHPVDVPAVDWVIVGGESGNGSRPTNVDDLSAIVEQCQNSGVPVFVKQLGKIPFTKALSFERGRWDGDVFYPKLRHKKGGDIDEWPAVLRVRELPAQEVRA